MLANTLHVNDNVNGCGLNYNNEAECKMMCSLVVLHYLPHIFMCVSGFDQSDLHGVSDKMVSQIVGRNPL